jgi:hypothetical protein
MAVVLVPSVRSSISGDMMERLAVLRVLSTMK